MEAIASALLTISAASWVGAIIFQSAIVAPVVFADLKVDAARRFLRTLFPRFFRLGIVCGVLMNIAILALVFTAGGSGKLLAIATASAIMLALQIISLRLVPHINAARDAGEAGAARFSRLHRLSVVLTVSVLLLGLLVVGFVGAVAAAALVA
jgi:hypothetical protein